MKVLLYFTWMVLNKFRKSIFFFKYALGENFELKNIHTIESYAIERVATFLPFYPFANKHLWALGFTYAVQ